LAKAAAAALIHYAKETQKTALPHIRSIQLNKVLILLRLTQLHVVTRNY
jgi:DNA mismatch repair ATPase MutS